MSTAANGAQCAPDDTVEGCIKQERLAQLSLANEKSREEAAARSGRYIKSEDARLEIGRAVSRLMTVFESSLTEFGNAIVANPPGSSRDALRILKATWREIRIRQSKAAGAEAADLPALMDDPGGGTGR